MNLLLHCGSRRVEREQLESAPTPARTRSWVPIPHHHLLAQIEAKISLKPLRSNDFVVGDFLYRTTGRTPARDTSHRSLYLPGIADSRTSAKILNQPCDQRAVLQVFLRTPTRQAASARAGRVDTAVVPIRPVV